MIKMRRNPTLPTIRQSTSAVTGSKPKQGTQSFRKIEDKINSHDQEIVKNQKIISTLANEFRLLKEQLQFEQQYSEKYKSTMSKYEEDASKHLKVIRDQKQIIAKLEHLNKEKDKAVEAAQKEKMQFKEKCQEQVALAEQLARQSKKKEATVRQLQSQLQKARKEIKQKQLQLKQKEAEFKEAFVSDRQIRESKIKKVEKDLQLLNIYLENSKEQIAAKDKELQRLSVELFQAEEKTKGGDKHEIKAKALIEEVKLAQRESEDLKKRVKELQEQNRVLQISLKTMESKSNSNANDKVKQLQQEKKELLERVDKLTKENQQSKRKLEQQRKQRQKQDKQMQQSREKLSKLESFSDKLMKAKGDITSQLSKLKGNILCDYCTKPMKNPVTNIPCGHSYCQECKAGYIKQCRKCSGVKREAVYRNQLLDQIIHASALIEKIVTLMAW